MTPYFSTTSSDDFEGSDGELQSSKGMIVAYGLSDKYDAHIKYESIKGEGGFVKGKVISLGIKYKLFSNGKNRFSGYLPITHSTQTISMDNPFEPDGNGSESVNFQTIEPTILGSSKLLNKYDINYSDKILIQIGGEETDESIGYVFNLSGSFPIPKLTNLTLIPEYGILIVDEESYNHSGIGLAVKF